MTKHHIANKDPQHENSLCEIFQPLSLANKIPLRNNSFFKNGMIVNEIGTAGVAHIIKYSSFSGWACKVHRWRKEYDAHLMPSYRKFDQKYNDTYPKLPLAKGSYCFGYEIIVFLHFFLFINHFSFGVHHCQQKEKRNCNRVASTIDARIDENLYYFFLLILRNNSDRKYFHWYT